MGLSNGLLSPFVMSYEPEASSSAVNFDNVMTKFIINKRIDAFGFYRTRTQNGQMLGMNEAKRRHSNCPFRKQSTPFWRLLKDFLTINKFFSSKLKKKEAM